MLTGITLLIPIYQPLHAEDGAGEEDKRGGEEEEEEEEEARVPSSMIDAPIGRRM